MHTPSDVRTVGLPPTRAACDQRLALLARNHRVAVAAHNMRLAARALRDADRIIDHRATLPD